MSDSFVSTGQFSARGQHSGLVHVKSTTGMVVSTNLGSGWVGTVSLYKSTDKGVTWASVASYSAAGTYDYNASAVGEIYRLMVDAWTSGPCGFHIFMSDVQNLMQQQPGVDYLAAAARRGGNGGGGGGGGGGATGSTGVDHSANAPTLPGIGNNFPNSGPYANYVLLQTIAANPNRKNVEIYNCVGAQIVVVRDDGTAIGGATPSNGTPMPIGGGAGPGQQGGQYTSKTFLGRLQIFAASALSGGAFIPATED